MKKKSAFCDESQRRLARVRERGDSSAIELLFIGPTNPCSAQAAARRLIGKGNAVAEATLGKIRQVSRQLMTTIRTETSVFLFRLKRKIPVVFINQKIKEDHMKKFFISPVYQHANKTAALHFGMFFSKTRRVFFYFAFLLCTYLLSGCAKEEISTAGQEAESVASKANNANADPFGKYEELDKQTAWELQQVRAATARYRHIKNAIKDGYVDINAVVPGMGYHYLKASLVDATFELRNPEFLVYDRLENGSFELVAVEYAVPIALSPNAPEGFTGTNDVWERNDALGLWFLHAWVWLYNPAGVFNPTNPLVHIQ